MNRDPADILLDHIRWASAKGAGPNYDTLSRALGCSIREAKEALFEFFNAFVQAVRTDEDTASWSAPS